MCDVYCNLPGTLKSQIFNLCIYMARKQARSSHKGNMET